MDKPPLVPGQPFIGNGFQLAADPIHFFVKKARQYGPVYRIRYPTAPNGEVWVIQGIEANRLASREGTKLFRTGPYYTEMTREIETEKYITALDGPEHAHFRKLMKPALSREATAPFLSCMIATVCEAASRWEAGQVLKVMPTVQRIAVEELSLVTSGCPIGNDQYRHLERFAKRFVGSGAAGQPKILLKLPSYKKSKNAVHGFLDELLRRHEAEPPGPDRPADVMDIVLSGAYMDGCPLNRADRLANAHLPLANGISYGGRVTGNLLYALLKHPEVMERVRREVDAAFAEGTPGLREFRRMTTLRNAIKETYRRHPLAPVVPRYVVQSFEYGGYTMPAGTFVFVGIIIPLFDARYFKAPYAFDPDRFAPPRSEGELANAFMPWGLGTHVCLSIGLMETLIMATTSGLLRTVDFELHPPDYELRIIANPMPGPDGNLQIRIQGQRRPERALEPAMAAGPGVAPADADEVPIAGLGLGAEELKRFAGGIVRRAYPPSEVVIRQGNEAEEFFVVVDGAAEVFKRAKDDREKRVARLGPGEYFGEIGLLHGVPRTATVRASRDGPLRVLAIGRELFTHMVSEHDLVSDEIAEMARRRMIVNRLANAIPGLDKARLRELSDRIARERYTPGEIVIRQGDEADKFYVIAEGEAEVVNHHPNGTDLVLARLGVGEYFGEIGILQNRPRTATVRAVGNLGLEVLAIDKEMFLEMREATSDSGRAIAEKALVRLLEIETAAR